MTSHKLAAEVLRSTLALGLESVADVVAWADRVIAGEAEPPPVFYELSLALNQSRSAVDDLLSQVPGEVSRTSVARELLGRVLVELDAGRLSARGAARRVYELASLGLLPESEFGYDPVSLEDSVDLAQKGIYGTVAEATLRVRRFLEKFGASAA